MTLFKKTSAIFKIYAIEALQYKATGLIYTLFDVVAPLISIFFWSVAFETQTIISGQTAVQLISYFVVSVISNILISPHPEYELSRQIYSGELSRYLLRPASIFYTWLVKEVAFKANRVVWGLLSYILLLQLSSWLINDTVSLTFTLLSPVILINSFLIMFIFKFTIGLVSIWLTDIHWMMGLKDMLTYILSGALLPLYLYPDWFQNTSNWLPFQFFTYIPTQVLLGAYSPSEVLALVGQQVFWIIALYLLYLYTWKRGVRRYESYGS